MDWDKLKIFHNVALDLNISEAAHKMNISHSSISRQISALERELKVSLFKRHARGLTLTEQGKILFKTAHDIFGKIALTEAQLTESKEKPTGSLTIAATVASRVASGMWTSACSSILTRRRSPSSPSA